ncbi:hypothetical protein MBLNU230_g8596t1 [Neophaeotheca triangularis]
MSTLDNAQLEAIFRRNLAEFLEQQSTHYTKEEIHRVIIGQDSEPGPARAPSTTTTTTAIASTSKKSPTSNGETTVTEARSPAPEDHSLYNEALRRSTRKTRAKPPRRLSEDLEVRPRLYFQESAERQNAGYDGGEQFKAKFKAPAKESVQVSEREIQECAEILLALSDDDWQSGDICEDCGRT